MDVIASTGFGIRVDSQKDRNNAFVARAKSAFDFKPQSPRILISRKRSFCQFETLIFLSNTCIICKVNIKTMR